MQTSRPFVLSTPLSSLWLSEVPCHQVAPTWYHYPDGEMAVDLPLELWGREVILCGTMAPKPQEALRALGLVSEALQALQCRVTAWIPYLAYMRQDQRQHPGHSYGARQLARMVSGFGWQRLITMDLHNAAAEGLFQCPVSVLSAQPLLVRAMQELSLKSPVVVAPDFGRAKGASDFADALGCPCAIVNKARGATGVTARTLFGDVSGRDVIMVDDLLATGNTLVRAAELCKAQGARSIRACVSHALFCGDARTLIQESPIEQLWCLDTIPVEPPPARCEVLSCAPILQAMLNL